MSLVSGNFFDLGAYSMGIYSTTLEFKLSDTATETGVARMALSGTKTRSVTVDSATGKWSLYIVATEEMPQDRYYTITAHYLNGENIPVGYEEFPWQIRVPEGVWNFADLVRDWSSPLAVGISTAPPSLLPAYWLNPDTGDFSRKKA